ncbi:MAG: RNA polymerase sigma factor [Candidatus Firestonebacteria bacterium]|nr:RNA polymerase sigma factor [Candidatus Firestonebacteria bacterium]
MSKGEIHEKETLLIQRAQKGDMEAFEDLTRAHGSYVFNLAYYLTGGNHADADDLAQTTFIRSFKAIKRFEGRSEFRTWLHRITVNLWKNMVRSQVRRKYFQHRSLNEPPQEGMRGLEQEIMEPSPDAAEQVAQNELKKIIQTAITQLPPDEREVTVLRDVEGYAYEEIAKLCKIPLGTVKSRLARARRLLREALEPTLGRTGNELR